MNEGLKRAIARALGDTESGSGSFRDNLEALVQKEGSGRAAARAIGVDEAQVRRWRAGKTAPASGSAEKLERAARAARVKGGDPVPADFVLKTKDRNDARRPPRTIRGDTNLRLDAKKLKAVKDAYVAGDDDRAVSAFLGAIGEGDFYRDYLDESRTVDRFGSGDYGAIVL